MNKDPMKSKQLDKGIQQLTDEGVAQLFIREAGNRKIVGTVGELQFEVIQYRLEHEYGAKCEFQAKPYSKACWIESDNESKLAEFRRIKAQDIVRDKDGLEVYLAPSAFMLNMEIQNFPEITFHFTSEFRQHKKKAPDALYLHRFMNRFIVLFFGLLVALGLTSVPFSPGTEESQPAPLAWFR